MSCTIEYEHTQNSVLFYCFRFQYPNNQTVMFERIVQTNTPIAITFDSTNRHLYWTEDEPHETIFRCDADGSNKTFIRSANNPSALTLDIVSRLVPLTLEKSFSYCITMIELHKRYANIMCKLTIPFPIYLMLYTTCINRQTDYHFTVLFTLIL